MPSNEIHKHLNDFSRFWVLVCFIKLVYRAESQLRNLRKKGFERKKERKKPFIKERF